MSKKPVILGTVSFTVCFAAWGLIGAFGPVFRETFGLNSTEAAFLIAVPVLLGSLARLPMGMLTDRFGGRAVFTALMLGVAVPVFLVPTALSYQSLLLFALLLGLAAVALIAVSVAGVLGQLLLPAKSANLTEALIRAAGGICGLIVATVILSRWVPRNSPE